MERVGRIMRIAVLIVLAMDHDVVKGDPWSEGVFDVFLSVLGRFWSFFGRFCVVFVVFVVLGGGPWSEWGGSGGQVSSMSSLWITI